MLEMIKNKKKENGFTLVELLIVVAIIAILVAISIPIMSTVTGNAAKSTDQANERAAKAEIVVEQMANGKTMDAIQVYDAAAGKLVPQASAATVTAYGQTADHKDDVLYIYMNGDDVMMKWASPKANPAVDKADTDWQKGAATANATTTPANGS